MFVRNALGRRLFALDELWAPSQVKWRQLCKWGLAETLQASQTVWDFYIFDISIITKSQKSLLEFATVFNLNPWSFTNQLAKSQDSIEKFIHFSIKTLFILLIRQSNSFSIGIDASFCFSVPIFFSYLYLPFRSFLYLFMLCKHKQMLCLSKIHVKALTPYPHDVMILGGRAFGR